MLDVAVRHRQGNFQIDAAFTTPGDRVTALFGRSGAGKSSLIAMIAGLRRPDAGRIALDGETLFDADARIDVPPHRRRLGVVFQEGRLFPHRTVRGNLHFGMMRAARDGRAIGFDAAVELLGLVALLDRRPARLSGGERQRVALGRALLSNPRLLLMDEPMASLDGARKAELLPYLGRMCRELRIPVLYVSHAVDEVLQLAERMLLLEGGRVIADGPVEAVMNRPDFAAVAGLGNGDGVAPFTVIAAAVAGHDDTAGTTRLEFPGGALVVPRLALERGARLRLRIEATDVILAREASSGLSVRNVLPAVVAAVAQADHETVDVTLDVGVPLRARVTRAAAAEMGLAPGRRIQALIKSTALAR